MSGERSGKNGPSILVGTSGYSYAEWVQAGFYPPATQSGRMLPFYARHFPVTELNYTWYQMPRAEPLERLRAGAPAGFFFAAKLTRSLTHEVDPADWRRQASLFREGIVPLVQGRQLLAVLVQLPPDFERTAGNRRYLAELLDSLAGLPLAVEFRHRSWLHDRVFAELERRRASLVWVDEPELPHLLPPLDVVTNPELLYVRFHGRNAAGWRSGVMQKKFDYLYSEAELRQWLEERLLPRRGLFSRGLLFFNNHVGAQAVTNGRQMLSLLGEAGF